MRFKVEISGELIGGWIACGLMLVGAFGPWVKGPLGISVSGTDGSNDGWIVAFCAVSAAVTFWGYARYAERALLVLTILAGIGGAAVGGYDWKHIRSALRVGNASLGSVGWGLEIATLAAVGVAVTSFVLFWHKPRLVSPPQAPSAVR